MTNFNNYNCSCCDAVQDLDDLLVRDCELVCEDCAEVECLEHTNDYRLSVEERNKLV